MTVCRHVSKTTAVRLIKTLQAAPEPLTARQIAALAEMEYDNAKNWLRFFVRGELVEFTGFGQPESKDGRGIRPAMYRWKHAQNAVR